MATDDPHVLLQVLSKGKVVDFGSQKFVSSTDNKQTLSFKVTPSMVPSIRLLVYYILFGEGTSELVADSVWLDVRDKCVNGLQVERDTSVCYSVDISNRVSSEDPQPRCNNISVFRFILILIKQPRVSSQPTV